MSLYIRFDWIDDGFFHKCCGTVNYRGVETCFYSSIYSNKQFGLLHSKIEVTNQIMRSQIIIDSMNDQNEFELRPMDTRTFSRSERFSGFQGLVISDTVFNELYPGNSRFQDERHDDDYPGERETKTREELDKELDEYMGRI